MPAKYSKHLGERKQDSYSWKKVQGREMRRKPLKRQHEQKPFLLSVNIWLALPSDAPVPGGMKELISILLGVPSWTMAPSLWSNKAGPESSGPCSGARCGGGSDCRSPLATIDENKSTKTQSAWRGKVADLSKEEGQEPVPQWAFIGFNLHRNT